MTLIESDLTFISYYTLSVWILIYSIVCTLNNLLTPHHTQKEILL